MPIIPSTILVESIKRGPILGPLSVWLWSRAYRSPNAWGPAGSSPTLGTRIDGVKEAARILGAPVSTVARHWPEFRRLFKRDRFGLWHPRPESWPAFSSWATTSSGFPRYLKIGGRALGRLLRLSRFGKKGWSSQRLAFSLLSPCLAKKSKGETSAPLSSRMAERWLSMSHRSLSSACELLAREGILELLPGKFRRVSLSSFLFEDQTKHGAANIHRLGKTRGITLEPDRAKRPRSPYKKGRIERDLKQLHREPLARFFIEATKRDIFGPEHTTDPVLPGLHPEAARAFSAKCETTEDAARWLCQESAGLLSARNPAGYFVHVCRKGSRPGARSQLERALAGGADLSAWERAPGDPRASLRGLEPEKKYLCGSIYLPGERTRLEFRARALVDRSWEQLTEAQKRENLEMDAAALLFSLREGEKGGRVCFSWVAQKRQALEELAGAGEVAALGKAREALELLEKTEEAKGRLSWYDRQELNQDRRQWAPVLTSPGAIPSGEKSDRATARAFLAKMRANL